MSTSTAVTIFVVIGLVVGGPIAAIIFGLVAYIAMSKKHVQ